MNINERIRQVVISAFGTQAAAARAMNVERQRIHNIISGVNPGLEFIKSLSDSVENLNLNWLINGKGEMYLTYSKASEKTAVIKQKEDRLDKAIKLFENEHKLLESSRKEQAENVASLREDFEKLKKHMESLQDIK
jgi:hypothetical protein